MLATIQTNTIQINYTSAYKTIVTLLIYLLSNWYNCNIIILAIAIFGIRSKHKNKRNTLYTITLSHLLILYCYALYCYALYFTLLYNTQRSILIALPLLLIQSFAFYIMLSISIYDTILF